MGKNVKMAKTLSLILALALCMVVFAGCSGDKKKEKKKETDVKEETTDKEIEDSDKEETGEKTPDAVIDLPVNDKIELVDAKAGDFITFGRYEQDNDTSNGKEDIEWLVLDKQDDKLLLISKYALDCKRYNEELKDVTWEECTLRSWLNNEFFKTAFTTFEQKKISTTKLSNEIVSIKSVGGNDTEDKVFLLSFDEANHLFQKIFRNASLWTEEMMRSCSPTEYALAQGVELEKYVKQDWQKDRCANWWLRTTSEWSNEMAATVTYYGVSKFDGGYNDRHQGTVNYDGNGVRPALWVSITD